MFLLENWKRTRIRFLDEGLLLAIALIVALSASAAFANSSAPRESELLALEDIDR